MHATQKFFISIVVCGLLASVVGCDKKEAPQPLPTTQEQQRSFSQKIGELEIDITYYFKANIILRQTTVDTFPYSILAANNKAQAQAVMDKIAEGYKTVAGLTQRVEYPEDRVRESLTIDLTRANINELCRLPNITPGMIVTDCSAPYFTQASVENFMQEQGFEEIK